MAQISSPCAIIDVSVKKGVLPATSATCTSSSAACQCRKQLERTPGDDFIGIDLREQAVVRSAAPS